AGLILTNPEGVEFTYALRFQFAASNNEAEYEALVAGLRIATQMRVKNVKLGLVYMATWGVEGLRGYCSDEMGVHKNSCGGEVNLERKMIYDLTSIKELPHVLWAHCTMIKSSHSDTPFSLTYGTESDIPTEIGMPIYRTAAVDVVNNDEELRLNLDLLEERRERAAVCEARAKSKMMKYYNARVRGVAFKPDDSVYRSNDASHAVASGKLGPKWEGPYEVT
nr:reverse transcriptase domain-containing protein [Tanacetum cinerariifolium]